jgi:hypothetical protein
MTSGTMPLPGDLHPGFFVSSGRCFRMIFSDQLQADHCYERPAWKGPWRDAKGRTWYVEACREHAPKLKGARGTRELAPLTGTLQAANSPRLARE